jgi:hypothetical protein
MKTWTVITNAGKQADLESGLEKKEIERPKHISARVLGQRGIAGARTRADCE